MLLESELELKGSQGELTLNALFDSDATYSMISMEHARQLAHLENLPSPLEFETANAGGYMRISQAVRLDFYLHGHRYTDEFMVSPALSEDLIIGATTMQKWKIKLDFENDEIITNPKANKLKLM